MSRYLFAFSLLSLAAAAQNLETLKKLVHEGQYREAVPGLRKLWEPPGPQSLTAGAYLGMSYCRLDGFAANGRDFLSYILQVAQLDPPTRQKLQSEFDLCAPAAAPIPLDTLSAISQAFTAKVSGKGGYDAVDAERALSRIVPAKLSPEDLAARLVPVSSNGPGSLLRDAMQRAQATHQGLIGNFALVASTPDSPQRAGECLLRYQGLLSSQFGLRPPTNYITVYLTTGNEETRRRAAQLHGFSLPPGTVAYSVTADSSIVGPMGDELCGTLGHELVHLMVAETLGPIPAWLEEGLASEVAIAYPRPARFEFGVSWRDQALRRKWKSRPQVDALLDLSWDAYLPKNTTPTELDRVAATHALSAVFIRYLDSSGRLQDVYRQVPKQRPGAEPTERVPTSALVANILGRTPAQLDADFVKWFGYTPPTVVAPAPTNQLKQ